MPNLHNIHKNAMRFSPYEGSDYYLSPELLCEDGFVTAEECESCDSAAELYLLVRRAARRGFPLEADRDAQLLNRSHSLIVKYYSDLRVWTDLVDEDTHLRAPPAAA